MDKLGRDRVVLFSEQLKNLFPRLGDPAVFAAQLCAKIDQIMLMGVRVRHFVKNGLIIYVLNIS